MKTFIDQARLLVALGSVAFALSAAAQAAGPVSPDVLAKAVTEEVMGALRADPDVQAGNQKKAAELVETRIAPYFDFDQLTQLAMGKHWRDASEEQRKRIASEFRAVLVRTYSNPLMTYRNRTVVYKPSKLGAADTRTTVSATVSRPDGAPLAIDLRMEKQHSIWKIYDVAIENVSLLENWRNQFNAQIQKDGVDGLIRSLADLNVRSRGTSG